ncbi:MAG: hypothetical protein UT32_C0002G0025 [Parcubacteria group bacterium GW2011_GWC2_39_14]|nr:MAG: hypothetical protein UT32_C0002G0025 [Parcubacteria group bacterium GW2011_GWC2_39_14]KKR55250.1 MAG: hypothetical protein UT91_C0003G0025 [Parcubacteria group bacterium GW2011_GWA2_40_23]
MKLPWISTDIIRTIMQKTVKKVDYPDLFYPAMDEAQDYLGKKSSQKIVDDQNKESAVVWRGVEAMIRTQDTWESYIIEGVAILPEYVSLVSKEVENIQPFFLYEERVERIREVIFTRGLWDEADKYSKELKEKEVEWVLLFNQFIKDEATKYGFPLIQYKDDGSYFEEIKKLFKVL